MMHLLWDAHRLGQLVIHQEGAVGWLWLCCEAPQSERLKCFCLTVVVAELQEHAATLFF